MDLAHMNIRYTQLLRIVTEVIFSMTSPIIKDTTERLEQEPKQILTKPRIINPQTVTINPLRMNSVNY